MINEEFELTEEYTKTELTLFVGILSIPFALVMIALIYTIAFLGA